jgi:hypothetical protein
MFGSGMGSSKVVETMHGTAGSRTRTGDVSRSLVLVRGCLPGSTDFDERRRDADAASADICVEQWGGQGAAGLQQPAIPLTGERSSIATSMEPHRTSVDTAGGR